MTSTRGARVLKVMMGLALMAMGSVAALYLGMTWKHAQETKAWAPVDAIVISSQVLTDRPTPHSPLRFIADVHFRYTFHGEAHTSTRIKRVQGSSSHKEDADALAAEYPLGKPVTCYVNPSDPSFAILQRESGAGIYSIWFPLLFVAGGIGMVISALRAK